jgi:hypothetical protein
MRAITVKELIEALKEQDQNAQVAVAADSEGNGFSLTPNEQFISIGFMTEELGYNEFEEEQKKGTKPTIVLWGSN